MDNGNNPCKHRRAAVYLDEVLWRTPPGGKLPGLRQLMAQSGFGRSILEQELAALAAEGRLSIRPREGCFRACGPDAGKCVWLLQDANYPYYPYSFIDLLFDTLRNLAAERDFTLRVISYSGLPHIELAAALTANAVERCFLYGASYRELAEFVRARVPVCVELLPHHTVKLGSEVRDSPEMTRIQLDYMMALGHRKIGYVHQLVPDLARCPVQYHRLFDYYRIMAERGCQIEPEWVFSDHHEYPVFNKSMYRAMHCAHPPSALIVPGGRIEFTYHHLNGSGIAIGDEFAVMGCDDIASELRPRATTVTNYPAEIARQAWEVMEAAAAGKTMQLLTELKIITGESVRRAAPASERP